MVELVQTRRASAAAFPLLLRQLQESGGGPDRRELVERSRLQNVPAGRSMLRIGSNSESIQGNARRPK